MAKTFHKPAPYLVLQDSYPAKRTACWLRDTFEPLLAKRLPTVLYGGFKHGFITGFVRKNKKEYPHFLKIDIEKFYPSLSHHHLTVEAQMSYKMLLGLSYVPKGFKKQFLPAAHAFFSELPITNYGIPLNSALSKAIAPLIYVPFFLGLKKLDYVKFIVFADDILILCKTKGQIQEVYIALFNYLQWVELKPNMGKVVQGRFSTTVVTFCGYHFAGGYVSVSNDKIKVFKAKIHTCCVDRSRENKIKPPRVFIKKINQNIAGFGHYYKCGNVHHTFEKLDSHIRANVREWFRNTGRNMPTNSQLEAYGLKSLKAILNKKKQALTPIALYDHSVNKNGQGNKHKINNDTIITGYLEKLVNQNVELIAQLKKIARALENL